MSKKRVTGSTDKIFKKTQFIHNLFCFFLFGTLCSLYAIYIIFTKFGAKSL